MKKIVSVLLAILMLSSFLYSVNAKNRKTANCSGHIDKNQDGICDVCTQKTLQEISSAKKENYIVTTYKTDINADIVSNTEGYGSISYVPQETKDAYFNENKEWITELHGTLKVMIEDEIKKGYYNSEIEFWNEMGLCSSALIDKNGCVIMPYTQSVNKYIVSDGVIWKDNTSGGVSAKDLEYNAEDEATDGYFDLSGNRLIASRFYNSNNFLNGHAFVRTWNHDEESYPLYAVGHPIIIDKTGKCVLELPWTFDTIGGIGASETEFYLHPGGFLGNYSDGLLPFGSEFLFSKSVFDYGAEDKNTFHFDYNHFRGHIGYYSYGYMDLQGNIVIPQQFGYCAAFSDGLACVQELIPSKHAIGKCGFIDRTGKLVIPYQYDMASGFKNNYCVVSIDDKYGVIDKNGYYIVPLEYDEIYQGDDNIYVYKKGNNIELRTLGNETIWNTTTDKCDDCSSLTNGVLYYIQDQTIYIVTVSQNRAIGDVSGDNEITAEDARLALRAAVGLESYAPGSAEFLAADATKDGEITAEDARLILRAAVGLENLT